MALMRRMGRYGQVGILCALLNNAIVIAMDQAGYHYAIGVIAGFVVVMVVGYMLHCSYTFGVRASSGGWLRFATANLSGFPLSMGSMYVLCDRVGLSASIAMPIATVCLLFWNYLLAYLVIARPARRAQ
jgi:putative flippase GtrA